MGVFCVFVSFLGGFMGSCGEFPSRGAPVGWPLRGLAPTPFTTGGGQNSRDAYTKICAIIYGGIILHVYYSSCSPTTIILCYTTKNWILLKTNFSWNDDRPSISSSPSITPRPSPTSWISREMKIGHVSSWSLWRVVSSRGKKFFRQ